MTNEERQQFTFQAIPNIDGYEPKLLFGMTFYEGMAVLMGAFIPIAIFSKAVPQVGLTVGLITAILTLVSLRRIERIGNVSITVYIVKRLIGWRKRTDIVLPRTYQKIDAVIRLNDPDGDHIATIK